MKKAGRGSILHDGWTSNDIHYIALFAAYAIKEGMKEEVITSLLSVSPMAAYTTDGSSSNEETIQFNASTHASHFEKVLSEFHLTLKIWAMNQNADNCPVNIKVA